MQKFLRTLMLVALLLPFASQAQNTLTVADGTATNSNVPIHGLYVDDFTRCQIIYPASEIEASALAYGMTGGTISSLTFYLSQVAATSWGDAYFEVKMMEVSATTLSGFVDVTNATTVYAGALDGTSSPMTITFTTPYTYQGGNLLLEIGNTVEGTYKSAYFYGVNATGASWQGYSGNSFAAITGSAKNFMPKTTFTFTGGTEITCRPVTNLAIDATATTANSLTLTWTDALNTSATYTVYNGDAVVATGISDTTYTVTGLDANTAYTFGVEANCSPTDAASPMTVSGRTACSTLSLPWTCGFEADEIVNTTMATALPWCSQRYTSTATSGTSYPYSYSSTTYAHSGSRCLYYYGSTSTSYPEMMAWILPELDVTTYPMNANRVTFWARMGAATNTKNVYVYTVSDINDINTATLVDSVTVSGTTQVKYSVPLTNANATDAYLALVVMRGTGSLYMDDVTLEEMPSCLEVPSVAVEAVTTNSITLSWVANELNATGTTYSVYNMADTSLVASNINDTTYTVDNLDANTVYTFAVQANCTAGDAPFTTVSGRTACAAFAVPYTWDFEDMSTGAAPLCWTKLTGGSANVSSGSSDTYYHSATKYVQFSGVAGNNILVLPETEDEISTLQVRFWTRPESTTNSNCGTFSVGYMTDITDATTFVAVTTYTYSDFTAYEEKTVTFGGAPDGARMAMRHDALTTGWYWRVDDVTIEEAPACLPVTSVTVNNITAESAMVHWTGTATNYNVYLGTATDTSLYQTTADDSLMISNLDPQTDYVVGVSAICGSDESPITYTTFRTACTAITIDANNLFSEGFEGTEFPPACWSTAHTAGSAASVWQRQTTAADVHTGSASAKLPDMQVGNKANLVTPMFDIDEAYAYQISFWMRRVSGTKPNEGVKVWVNTTPDTIGGTPLMHIRRAFNQGDITEDAAGWYQYSAAIPTSGNVYIIFEGISEYGNYSSIDDISIEEAPSCLPVSGLTATDITADGATLTWTGNATSYNVYAIAADTTFVQNVTDATIDLTNLTANTQYTYGVRSACGNDESDMVSVTFRTACSAIAIPYTEDFEDGIACWTLTSCASGTGASTSYPYSGTHSFKFAYNTNPPQYLISPELSGTEDGVVVNFMYRVGGSYQESFALGYSTTTADVTAFTWLTEQTGLTNQTYEPYMQILPADVKYVAIKYTANDMLSLYIDDFSVTEIPDCAPVTDLAASNVTADSATLTWTGTADSYNVYTIVGDDTTLVDNVTDMFIELGNLTAMTSYTYGVASVCGSDESEMRSVGFTTACAAIAIPYTENFEDTSATFNCWTVDGVSSTGLYYGAFRFYYSDNPPQYLVSPELSGVTDGVNVSFLYKAYMSSYPESFQLGYSTTTNAYADFTWLPEVSNITTTEYTEYSQELPGAVKYVAIKYTANDQYYLYIDSMVFAEPAPAEPCLTPEIVIDSVTIDTNNTPVLHFSWTTNANAIAVITGIIDDNGAAFAGQTYGPAGSQSVTLDATRFPAGSNVWLQAAAVCSTGDTSDGVLISAVIPSAGPIVECGVMNLPFNETFDSASVTRDCWTAIDADNDGFGWTTMYNNADQEIMLSASYDDEEGALTPDNWLVSPKIHTVAGNNITLQWSVGAADNDYAAEHYGVYVSTTTTDTTAFTLLNEWTLTSSSFTTMTLDLSAYAGQDIYVAFRHFNCTDMYMLLLDNVSIYEGAYVPDTLTVVLATDDATMGTTNPVPGTYQYIDGDTVSFSAVANTGYHFVGWEYTVIGDTTTYTYANANVSFLATSMMSAGTMTFTAYFEADPTCTVAIPYAEDFSTDYADYCWTKVDCHASTGLYNETFRFRYSTTPPQYLISPELTGTGATLQFEFDYYAHSATYPESFMVGYSTTTNDTNAFTWSTEVTNIANTTAEHYTQVFNASAIKYVAIKYTANDMYYLYIDNVVVRDVPTCAPVTNLTVDSVSATTVSLSWTDTENTGATYTVYNGQTAVVSGLTTTSYTITGLTAATDYTFGVEANCSATDASDMMTVSLRTECTNGGCDITIATNGGYGLLGASIDVMQNGAVVANVTSTGYNDITETVSVCSDSPVSFVYNAGGTYDSYVAFTIADGAGTVLYTCTSGSNMTDGAVFTTIATPCPTCMPVQDLTVDTATTTSVTISWAGNAASYDVYNGTTYVASVTTNAYTFTGLMAATNYTFGVQAICSATDSAVMTTVAAATACAVINTFPYVQDFNSEPACWTAIDADGDGYNWFIYSNAMQSASYSGSALTPDNWLISPQFALPSTGNYEVTWTAMAQDQSWPAEHYGVYVSTTGNNTTDFTMLQEWTLSTGAFNPVIDLSSYAGQTIYIALRHFNCTDQFRMSIDDFIVREQAGANQVVINVQQNNPAYGSVSGAGTYNIGDSVTVSATAASGYVFNRWVDTANATISTANPYTFEATTDLTLKAIFLDEEATMYTITVSVNDSTMGTATGGGSYAAGDVVTLSATAFTGYHFVDWVQISGFGENVVSTTATFSVTATGNLTFRANFAIDSVPPTTGLTVTFATNDATMGTTNPAPGTYTYQAGDTVLYAATPTTGYYFQYWVMTYTYQGQVINDTSEATEANGGFLVSTLLGYGINHIDMTAFFAIDSTPQPQGLTVTFTTNNAAWGTTNPAPGTYTYQAGDSVFFNAIPTTGNSFVEWIIEYSDGTADTLGTQYQSGYYIPASTIMGWGVTSVTFNAFFQAGVPTPDSIAVTYTVNNASMGSINPSGTVMTAVGDYMAATATANTGYELYGWQVTLSVGGQTLQDTTFLTSETSANFGAVAQVYADYNASFTITALFQISVGIEDVTADMNIYSTDNKIIVKGAEGEDIYIYDLNGRTIATKANANETMEFTMTTSGVYMVKVGNAPAKRVLVVR